jgi:hypothetical protein
MKAWFMPSLLRSVGRCFLLLALAWNITPMPQAKTLPTDNSIASLPPEVRLRKLHLVRPDLIPFPIAYEVCC